MIKFHLSNFLSNVFQPFSSRGTSQKFLIMWRNHGLHGRNLNTPYSTIYSIFREPSKELAEPLGSAEPRLKNTDLDTVTLLKGVTPSMTSSWSMKN